MAAPNEKFLITPDDVEGWSSESDIVTEFTVKLPAGWMPLGMREVQGLPVLDFVAPTDVQDEDTTIKLIKVAEELPANYRWVARWQATSHVAYYVVIV